MEDKILSATSSPRIVNNEGKYKKTQLLDYVSSERSNMSTRSKSLQHILHHSKLKASIDREKDCRASSTPVTPLRHLRNSDEMPMKISTPEIYTTVRFDTPKRSNIERSIPTVDAEMSNLVVAVRVRPCSAKEESDKDLKEVVEVKNSSQVNVLTQHGQTHTFNYDYCFPPRCPLYQQNGDQARVYENLAKPLLFNAIQGYNTCLFAYGQTGSGKSYSIMGTIGCEKELHKNAGIVPRFCHDLFKEVDVLKTDCSNNMRIQIQISYFEIYKEKIRDLLNPSKANSTLRVREHPQTGPYVVDLSQHAVCCFEEVQKWLAVGNRQRATASTSANERSSRSHAIFTISLAQSYEELLENQIHEVRKQSRINFIDLAGSERVASSNAMGERREEGLTINQSLLTLGRVITALADQTFVPYRESVLTWLLKESLGGDSKTVMLATVSPYYVHIEETLSTLRYACQARTIVNTARVYEDPNGRLIRLLREQIKHLEQRAQATSSRFSTDADVPYVKQDGALASARVKELETEIQKLKNQLADVESTKKESSWQDRIAEAEEKRAMAEEALAKYGLSIFKDPKQPCLVNVNQDPLLSGTLFFPLKPGHNWVGPPMCSSDPPEIQLVGPMIEENHCCFDNIDGVLTVIPHGETYVNGQLVTSDCTRLRHGDRIIIAGSHFFHLHYPLDCQNVAEYVPSQIVDFETAYEELRHFQEKRLQAAVHDAQEKTRLQLLAEMEELKQEAALEISLQRHSYEDEIASLNRVLERNKVDHVSSPLVSSPVILGESATWKEIEALVQDTQRRLEESRHNPPESSFLLQSMLNEANAISRRFQTPYIFSRKNEILDDAEPTVSIQDRSHNLVMHWGVEKMRLKLEALREAIEESRDFPYDIIFEKGDMWELEDDAQTLIAPSIRDKLEKLKTRQDSETILDESRISLDSSRRSSLVPRSPSISTTSITAEACIECMSKFEYGDQASVFDKACSHLYNLISHPDRTVRFAVSLTSCSLTFLSLLPSVVQQMLIKKDVPMEIQKCWLEHCKELGLKLQNSLKFVLQGITLDSIGLFNEWVQRAQEIHCAIIQLYIEVSVVCFNRLPKIDGVSPWIFKSAFVAAQRKVHQAVITMAEGVRLRIAQLPDEFSGDSFDSTNSVNNGWLIKACHDCVAQTQILLERLSDSLDELEMLNIITETELESSQDKFHQKISILLRLVSAIQSLFSFLEKSNLAQVKSTVAELELQATIYVSLADNSKSELFLHDISFAVGMVQKIVAERNRMTALRRGRNISYSPLPAQLLASSRKRSSNFGDDEDCINQNSDADLEYWSEQESQESVLIPRSVIQRALQFQIPLKSSLKSSTTRRSIKTVRFTSFDSHAVKPIP